MSTPLRIGEVIRRLRLERELSLSELATQSGAALEETNLSKFERGRQGLSVDKIQALAKVLGVTVAEIFAEAEGARPFTSLVDPTNFADSVRITYVVTGDRQEDGRMERVEGNTPAHRACVRFIADGSKLVALLFNDDTMEPRIGAHEAVVATSMQNCDPKPGDDVVVITNDQQILYKRLLYIRGDTWYFGSVNGKAGTVSLDRADISEILVVMGIATTSAIAYPKNS
jgi:transcriptional regulator with XRE-family HTH domain